MAASILDLLDDLRAGRDVRDAQEKVYRFVSERLLQPLRSHIGERVRSRLDAEDVLHEAILRAVSALPTTSFASEKSFLAWVYRIARNLVADQAKRCSAAALAFADESRAAAPRASRLPARGGTVESQIQRRDWLEAALHRLKPREAEVIRLYKLEGKSFETIASEWGREPATVKRLYGLALKRLKAAAGADETGA